MSLLPSSCKVRGGVLALLCLWPGVLCLGSVNSRVGDWGCWRLAGAGQGTKGHGVVQYKIFLFLVWFSIKMLKRVECNGKFWHSMLYALRLGHKHVIRVNIPMMTIYVALSGEAISTQSRPEVRTLWHSACGDLPLSLSGGEARHGAIYFVCSKLCWTIR